MQAIHVQKEPEGTEELQPKQNSNKTTAIWKTTGRQWIRQNNAVSYPEKVKFDGNTHKHPNAAQHTFPVAANKHHSAAQVCPTSIKQTPYYSTKCLLKSGKYQCSTKYVLKRTKYHSAAQNTWTLPITLLS